MVGHEDLPPTCMTPISEVNSVGNQDIIRGAVGGGLRLGWRYW